MRALDVRRITGVESLLWTAATVIPLALVARAPGPRDVVDAYLAAIERRDVDAALGLLDAEPVLETPLAGKHVGGSAARAALEWRAATGYRLEVERLLELDESDGRVSLAVRERSRVLDLLGAEQRYQSHYYVSGRRIRAEMWIPSDRAADAAMRDSLGAFARWLDSAHPGERDELFDRGRPRWSDGTADRWLARLGEWRAGRP